MAFRLIPFVAFVVGLVTVAGGALAQQVQPAPKPKSVNEIEAAQQAAKTAAFSMGRAGTLPFGRK